MSNSLDPDQADILSGLIWVQTVCKCYQQTTLAGKELKCNPGFVPDISKFRFYFRSESYDLHGTSSLIRFTGFVKKWENRIPGLFSFFKDSISSQFCIKQLEKCTFSSRKRGSEKAHSFLFLILVIKTGTTTHIKYESHLTL